MSVVVQVPPTVLLQAVLAWLAWLLLLAAVCCAVGAALLALVQWWPERRGKP